MFTPQITRPWAVRVCILLALALMQTALLAAVQPALLDYQARLPAITAQVPAVIASAEAAAARLLAHPEANINVPYWEQMGFAEELINRAGGLANILPTDSYGRPPTPFDVVLLSVRSWETQRSAIVQQVREYQAQGWTVTVIGSAAGKPRDLGADYFLDNGAPSGKASLGRINVLANVTLGWLWCCEYASALSRQGKFPAVLQSICIPGGQEYDRTVQTQQGRYTQVECETPVAEGALAYAYLGRVQWLAHDLRGARVQEQLDRAAAVIAQRLADGGRVGIAGMGHLINEEVKHDNATPWLGFRVVGIVDTSFAWHLQPGDLLVWMSYNGMNSIYDDYARYIAASQVELISCYAPDPEFAKDPPPTLAHIDQSWKLPDAEVAIPVFPDYMAPISGLNVTLLARMLDDTVAARLRTLRARVPAPTPPPIPPNVRHRFAEQGYYNPESLGITYERRWGLIDWTGAPVQPLRFDEVGPCREGLAAVRINGRWGFMDAKGALVIPPVYDEVSPFTNGSSLVRADGRSGLIDATGAYISPRYDRMEQRWQSNASYYFTRTAQGWGVCDASGAEMIPPQYEALSPFSDQAVVFRQDRQEGVLALTGEVLIAPQYQRINGLRSGYALVQRDSLWGAIDAQGNEVIPLRYAQIREITGDMMIVRTEDNRYTMLNHAGEPLLSTQYDQILRFGNAPVVPVRVGMHWGVINRAGTEVVPPIYEDAIIGPSGTVICVKQQGRWGLIDVEGNTLLPCEYEFLADLGGGRFTITRDDKWGVIDIAGKAITPCKYSMVLRCNNTSALVAVGGVWREDAGPYPVLLGAKWGVIDATGREIIPPKYDYINPTGEAIPVANNVKVRMATP